MGEGMSEPHMSKDLRTWLDESLPLVVVPAVAVVADASPSPSPSLRSARRPVVGRWGPLSEGVGVRLASMSSPRPRREACRGDGDAKENAPAELASPKE